MRAEEPHVSETETSSQFGISSPRPEHVSPFERERVGISMRRGSYIGGSTKARLGPDGTSWEKRDNADRKEVRSRQRQRDRAHTREELELQEQEDAQIERKLTRSFVSQCAKAYFQGKLSGSFPTPPQTLVKRIRKAGGNVKMALSQSLISRTFYATYCHVIGRYIPLGKVWGSPKN